MTGADITSVYPGVKPATLANYADIFRALWTMLHEGVRSPESVTQDLNWAVDQAPEIAARLQEKLDRKQLQATGARQQAQRVLSLNRRLRPLDKDALKTLEEISKAGDRLKREKANAGAERVTDAHPTVRDLRDNFRILDALLDIVKERGGEGASKTQRERLVNAHIIYGFLATNADILAIRINELINLPLYKTEEDNYLDTQDNVLVLRDHKTAKKTGPRMVYLHPSFTEVMRKSLAFFPRDALVTCSRDNATRAVKRFFFIPETTPPNMLDIREIVITNYAATAIERSPTEFQQFVKDSGTSMNQVTSHYNLAGKGYGKKVLDSQTQRQRCYWWIEQRAREAFFEVFS